jgi:hypothetical protein
MAVGFTEPASGWLLAYFGSYRFRGRPGLAEASAGQQEPCQPIASEDEAERLQYDWSFYARGGRSWLGGPLESLPVPRRADALAIRARITPLEAWTGNPHKINRGYSCITTGNEENRPADSNPFRDEQTRQRFESG